MTIEYSQELRRIKDNIIKRYTSNRGAMAKENDKAITAQLYRDLTVKAPTEGGYRFSDISYGERIGANWDIGKAMTRVMRLSELFYLSDFKDLDALDLIVGHLKDFLEEGYVSTNWYHNDLGVPAIMNKTMIFTEDHLPKDIREKLINYIANGSVAVHPEIIEVKNAYHSGANLTNYCNVSIHHGLFTHNEDEILAAVNAVVEETYGGREGMQSDGSFFQHGRRLYSLSYGKGYIGDIARILCYIEGTRFDFPFEAKENLLKHVLDGVRYMVGAKGYDYSPSGRGYTRTNALASRILVPDLKILAELENMPRRDEIIAFIDDIEAGRQPVKGIKYFPVARFLTLHTDNLYVSFRGAGPDIRTSEICTFENYMGVNLSYGTNTCVMRDGLEYFNVSGIWDYSAIPGTTARYEDDETIIAYPDFTRYEVDTDDFGGDQIGNVGVCYIGAENYGVRATKCAVALDNCMIIMGAGISEKDAKVVRTSVEQCNAMGDVTVSENGMKVMHSGIVYRNLDRESPFVTSIEHRAFETERNGRRITPYHVEGDLLNIKIYHKENNSKYAYLITEEELYSSTDGVKVLQNTKEIQAVKLPDGRLVAVFHEAGELSFDGKTVKGEKNQIIVQ